MDKEPRKDTGHFGLNEAQIVAGGLIAYLGTIFAIGEYMIPDHDLQAVRYYIALAAVGTAGVIHAWPPKNNVPPNDNE